MTAAGCRSYLNYPHQSDQFIAGFGLLNRIKKIRRIRSFKHEEPYRLGTEFGGEYVAYGREQQHVELLAQAEEVAEGEDDHLFGVSVQPLSYLHQHGLPGKHKVGFSLPLRQDSIV